MMIALSLVLSPAYARKPAVVYGAKTLKGLVELSVNEDSGRIWMKLPPLDPGEDVYGTFILFTATATGLGSNPVGIDRGELGGSRLVQLRRVGGKVLLEQRNTGFRADSDDPAEVRAVEQSFATSVLWGGDVELGYLELTPLFTSDLGGLAGRMTVAGQGGWELDRSRSAIDMDAVVSLPDNVVVESVLTFASSDPGAEVRSVAPSASSVTLRQLVSLVRLPQERYEPLPHDPRAGFFAMSYLDYAAPLYGDARRSVAFRHRPPTEGDPLVYYVDPGAPEPVRSALLEGARWWADAFEPGAFRVELLPADVHPLDVRYNVIQWVHRATRGWSYGSWIHDPRTGEILKGHVSLGSLRVRHDRVLFEALLGADKTGSGDPDDPVELALARIRQLAAHEVGHTLGLAHNFAGSTYGGRASVMDYPAPLITLEDDALDTSGAYGVGIGDWDVAAMRWGYRGRDVPDLLFLTDADARPSGAAHPAAALWDNGDDAAVELERLLAVRGHALGTFGETNVVKGAAMQDLEERFAVLWFLHRYQVAAAAKMVGGVTYTHGVRGFGEPARAEVLPAADQKRALDALLAALADDVLTVPAAIPPVILPRAPGSPPSREQIGGLLDTTSARAAAAGLVIGALLDPVRAGRLVDQTRRDPEQLSLAAILTALLAIDDVVVREMTVRGMVGLAARGNPLVRAEVEAVLKTLDHPDATRWLERREPATPGGLPALPPGSPIGCGLE